MNITISDLRACGFKSNDAQALMEHAADIGEETAYIMGLGYLKSEAICMAVEELFGANPVYRDAPYNQRRGSK